MADQESRQFVIVSQYLEDEQNIADQPPFTWFEQDEKLFPIDFFREVPHAFVFVLRAVAFSYPWSEEVVTKYWAPKGVNEAYGVIDKEYKKSLTYVAGKLWGELEAYQMAREYLRSHWGSFTAAGEPRKKREDNPTLSYAGYLEQELAWVELSKWIGLEESLPDSTAAPDIIAALPPKKPVNRLFRIYRSEALK